MSELLFYKIAAGVCAFALWSIIGFMIFFLRGLYTLDREPRFLSVLISGPIVWALCLWWFFGDRK